METFISVIEENKKKLVEFETRNNEELKKRREVKLFNPNGLTHEEIKDFLLCLEDEIENYKHQDFSRDITS